MMRAAVDPVDDDIGRALQLIIQPARNQTADHGCGLRLAMQDKVGDAALPSPLGQASMDALDDVIAFAELLAALPLRSRQATIGRGRVDKQD